MEKVWHARAERQTRKMQQTYWYVWILCTKSMEKLIIKNIHNKYMYVCVQTSYVMFHAASHSSTLVSIPDV